ncbi:MAG: hypothetical protein ABI551_26305 [Polyangiaceae bacterium]
MDGRTFSALSRLVKLVAPIVLVGCGGTALLHGPVVDRCESAGLKGCDEIADGVIAVADGKKEEGLAKIERGAGNNAPQDVREFADKLNAVSELPGLGSFKPTLKEVATALRISPGVGGSAVAQPDAKVLQDQQLAAVQGERVSGGNVTGKWRAGTARPSVNGEACDNVLGPHGQCERVLIGPAEITSLVAGGGCSAPMIVFAGDAKEPRWSVVIPANGSVVLATTTLPLDDAEGLGVATTSGAPTEPACGVMWVAKRR